MLYLHNCPHTFLPQTMLSGLSIILLLRLGFAGPVPSAPNPKCPTDPISTANVYVSWSRLQPETGNYCSNLVAAKDEIGIGQSFRDTPEAVEIYARRKFASEAPMPTFDECQAAFRALGQCDPASDQNPMDWKSGGEVEFNDWIYSFNLLHPRPPAPKKAKAWCEISDCDDASCTLRLWGAGWETYDHGEELRAAMEMSNDLESNQVEAKGIRYRIEDWASSFTYELMDEHEWYLHVSMDRSSIHHEKEYTTMFLDYFARGTRPAFAENTAFNVTCV